MKNNKIHVSCYILYHEKEQRNYMAASKQGNQFRVYSEARTSEMLCGCMEDWELHLWWLTAIRPLRAEHNVHGFISVVVISLQLQGIE